MRETPSARRHQMMFRPDCVAQLNTSFPVKKFWSWHIKFNYHVDADVSWRLLPGAKSCVPVMRKKAGGKRNVAQRRVILANRWRGKFTAILELYNNAAKFGPLNTGPQTRRFRICESCRKLKNHGFFFFFLPQSSSVREKHCQWHRRAFGLTSRPPLSAGGSHRAINYLLLIRIRVERGWKSMIRHPSLIRQLPDLCHGPIQKLQKSCLLFCQS